MNLGLRVHFPRLLLYNATCGSGSKLLLLHNISTVGSQMTSPGYDYSRLIWSDSKTVICCCGMCSDALSCVPTPQPLFSHQTFHITHNTHTHSYCPLSVKTGGLPACLFRPNTYTHPSNQYFSLSLHISSLFLILHSLHFPSSPSLSSS